MERKYWMGRNAAAIGMAQRATTAEARLIHYELAGLYSIKASRSTRPFMLARKGPATIGERAVLLASATAGHGLEPGSEGVSPR